MWPAMHHHHLGLALIEEGVEKTFIALQDDPAAAAWMPSSPRSSVRGSRRLR